jgi:hypothetical protein
MTRDAGPEYVLGSASLGQAFGPNCLAYLAVLVQQAVRRAARQQPYGQLLEPGSAGAGDADLNASPCAGGIIRLLSPGDDARPRTDVVGALVQPAIGDANGLSRHRQLPVCPAEFRIVQVASTAIIRSPRSRSWNNSAVS